MGHLLVVTTIRSNRVTSPPTPGKRRRDQPHLSLVQSCWLYMLSLSGDHVNKNLRQSRGLTRGLGSILSQGVVPACPSF